MPPRQPHARAALAAILALLVAAPTSNLRARTPETEIETDVETETEIVRDIPPDTLRGRASFEYAPDTRHNSAILLVTTLGEPETPNSETETENRNPAEFPVRLTLRSLDRPAPTLDRVGIPWKLPAPNPATHPARHQPEPIDNRRLPTPPAPEFRTFHLKTRPGDHLDTAHYETVRATLAAEAPGVRVYLDDDDRQDAHPELAPHLARAFALEIEPRVRNLLGPALDVDRDGAFAILLSRRVPRVGLAHARQPDHDHDHDPDCDHPAEPDPREAPAPLQGFVRPSDFDLRIPPPFSNRADMLALDAALPPGPHARTLLAHEFAHAALHSRRVLERGAPDEEQWLDEAVAHVVEDLHAYARSNIEHRVEAFLREPHRHRLVVHDYHRANLFRAHGNRGATYLFLRWAVEQHGEDLLRRLARNPDTGARNLREATGIPFPDLYRAWTIRLARNSANPRATPRQTQGQGPTLPIPTLQPPESPDALALHAWDSAPTATRYLRLPPHHAPLRVEIQAPPEANLQITLILLQPPRNP